MEYRDSFDLIYIGRYALQKNIFQLLKVAKELIKYDNNIRLHIFGFSKNDLNEDELNIISNYDLNFIFHGFLNDIRLDTYKNPIGIFTSLFEGMSLALLEMLSNGIPVVANDVSGMREVLIDNECGIIVQENSTSNFTTTIIKLINDKNLYNTFSINAKNIVNNKFSKQIMLDKHIQLYRKLMKI